MIQLDCGSGPTELNLARRGDQYSATKERFEDRAMVVGPRISWNSLPDNKLIRPRAEYVVSRNVPYVPIDKR
jgi:hypothetical protein